MKRLLFIALMPIVLMGCATLNKSECHNADWYMIGMEDGAKGLLPSYIGKHRTACAKFNVTPDLNQYRRGHQEGVRQFCTESRGFNMGRNGQVYNDLCPADLEGAFLKSYNAGRELRSRQIELDRIDGELQAGKGKIEKLEDEIKERKQKLISGASTEKQRADLLDEIEDLQDQRNGIENKIYQQKRNYERQKRELEADQLEFNER